MKKRKILYKFCMHCTIFFTSAKIFFFDMMMTDRNLTLIKTLTVIFFSMNHLLCVWHVNKNVFVHCKFSFEIKKTWNKFYIAWQIVIYIYTFEIFAIAWIKLQNDYYTKHFHFIEYLNVTWIKIFVKQLIRFHINKIRYFFIIITFRSKMHIEF